MQSFTDADGAAPQAVRAGNLIFVGGLMATDANGNIVAPGIAGQARVIFERLAALLAQAGATMADVVKHNIYFSCEADVVGAFLDELDSVRTGYFTAPGPTSTEIRCGLDSEGARLMVDAWVVTGGKRELLDPPGHWRWRKKLPFVQGWKVADMLFIGGQRPLDAEGKVLGRGDIEVQTEEAFRNLDTMLRQGGGDRNSLMRQNTYFRFFGEGREVTDYWEKMTNVRRRYMSVPSAAGAGLRIQGMGNPDELIQVEGIGMLGEDKQRLQPANHWDWSIPNTQFTQGWKIGRLAFIGGQISADSKAQAVGDDMETQTRNVFEFIRRTLAEGGLDESDVAKLYIYYHAEGSWAEIDAIRAVIARVQREFYPLPGPAVTAIRVAGFAFENLLVEIEAMAVTRD
ncbi:RidA family protein [Mesorhizobium qingshengii]|uniref:RidA family protein n=1 Tax=Mesorhizobium qingshengii TaxID=1165689 RepID=A0ABT4R413_9HYPH|nr:RidA family protein [Mesorhizobium qingshengii]MCZ8548580.1 RidA family protein [Mesorhizobium qingshengii]